MQIPDYYEFFNQLKIESGTRVLESIPAELAGYDAYKPLVIADRSITESGLVKKFIKAFADSGMTLGGIYDEVRDYAGISLALNAEVIFRERGCDSIIALGSGPTVDVAKALNVLVSENSGTLQPYLDGAPIGKRLKPLIYTYACCSTGLEATGYMTIDNRVIRSDLLFPDVIMIDPRLTPGCCASCVAESAVVMLDHALTAGSDEDHSPMIDAYVNSALRFLSENLRKGLKSPGNTAASMALANASAMAAVAFYNSKPGMVHCLAVELAKLTGTSAGKFMRVLLPYVLAFKLTKKQTMRDELYLALAGYDRYAATPAAERTGMGIEAVLALLNMTKKVLPQTMKELNVPQFQLKAAAEAASAASGKRFSAADCLTLLEHAWEGRAF